MADLKKLLDGPFMRPFFAFVEPSPVGLFVMLISATMLSKK